jgi:hypothetical protein
MTDTTRPRPHTVANRTRRRTTDARAGARRLAGHAHAGARRRPSLQLISDGVVAAYIHDISSRHGHPAPVSASSPAPAG